MKQLETTIPGVVLLELDVFGDHRGRFMETYRRERYIPFGIAFDFVQDNYSSSQKGTLRGLHYQLTKPQGKLVWVTRGEVFDVAVDIRRGSPTFGKWFGSILSEGNHQQMYVPPGFAHGFVVLSESADFLYKCTQIYDPKDERSIRWNDPDLAIQWPIAGDPTLSAKDREAPPFRAADLPDYVP